MNYTLVSLDDFSRFFWIIFLCSKDQTNTHLIKILKTAQNEKSFVINKIQSDHDIEFTNKTLGIYLYKCGIRHACSAARTPKKNGVA